MKVFFLSITIPIITTLAQLGGEPKIVEQVGAYTQFALTDSTTLEVYVGDSIWEVLTVCAPQCSSCARVYNKEGELLHPIEPPIQTIFPLATMDKATGRITWTDNDNWEY
ncbi:MAG: hypothetical protein IJS82_05040 [Paludibacteraceae bacterium]|nr:hypothetical protein [Paludibacteraceae bacterium]